MELIKSLASIVTPNKTRHLPLNLQTKDLTGKLYQLVSQSDNLTDEEAINQLFGPVLHQRKYLNETKTKLRNRLIDSLLFIDPDDNSSNLDKAIFRIHKAYSTMHICRYVGLPKVAKNLAAKYIDIALEFDQTNEALSFCFFLKHYYSSIDRNKKQFDKYSNLVAKLLDIQNQENRLYNIYLDLLFGISDNKSVSKETLNKALIYSKMTKELLSGESINFKIAFWSYSIQYISAELHKDHLEIVSICEKGLNYFNSIPSKVSKPAIFHFTYYLVPLYINLGKYEEALLKLDNAISLVKPGSFNWIVCYRYFTIIVLHQQQYEKAQDHCQQVKIKGRFQYGRIKEDWMLFEAYIHLFQEAYQLPFKTKVIRPAKFINEIESYSKDKRNTYFNARVAYFLLLLQQGRTDQLIEIVDGMDRYAHRYLKQPDSIRAYYLFKLLILIPKWSFDKDRITIKSKPWLEKLNSTDKLKQDADLELVPFEDLWELALGLI